MNAIPTKYAGVQFRSRLEARWAAFFDLIGWPWEYEPIDLAGYIPDFVLGFERPMIVEVKPLTDSVMHWDRCKHPAAEALAKIEKSGWQGEGILVGAALLHGNWAMGHVPNEEPVNLGVLFSTAGMTDTGIYSSPFGIKACCGGPVDVVGLFSCRRCGHHDSGPTLMSSACVLTLWRAAGNRVQWRGVEARP